MQVRTYVGGTTTEDCMYIALASQAMHIFSISEALGSTVDNHTHNNTATTTTKSLVLIIKLL